MFVRPRPPPKPTRDEAKPAGAPEGTPETVEPASTRHEDEPRPSLAFFIGGTTEAPPRV